MPITHLVNPSANHRCDPPYNPPPETLYGTGTIWQCDVCHSEYKLVCDARDGYVWQFILREYR